MRALPFPGFYIVRADLRGCGYGMRIWNAAIALAGARVIGLDGVTAQQDNYKKSGFRLAYANVRYGGTVAAPAAPRAIALSDVPFAAVEADDATVFQARRSAFLRAWIGAPSHAGCALVRDFGLAPVSLHPSYEATDSLYSADHSLTSAATSKKSPSSP